MKKASKIGYETQLVAAALALLATMVTVGGPIEIAGHYGRTGADARMLAAVQAPHQVTAAMAHHRIAASHRSL